MTSRTEELHLLDLQRVKLEDWDKVPVRFRKLTGRDQAPTAKEIVGTMTVIRFLYEAGRLEEKGKEHEIAT